MERWSLKYFDDCVGGWITKYYYTLREYAVARERLEESFQK